KRFGPHPAQKPLTLLTRMVRIWTAPGQIVLDCFLGTGTTAMACAALGRQWVGIEKDSIYGEIARKRLAGMEKDLFLRDDSQQGELESLPSTRSGVLQNPPSPYSS